MFLIDEKGQDVSGSIVTALVAKAMLAREPGAKIIYNLICSWTVPEVIRENGGVPVRTRVGHSFIKQVMAETGRDLRRGALGPLLLPGELSRGLRA